MIITAEYHLFSMKYSNFCCYICYLLPQHGLPLVLPLCLSHIGFFTLQVFWGIHHMSKSVYKPAKIIRINEKKIIDTMFPVHV